jgi:hypothetical protein
MALRSFCALVFVRLVQSGSECLWLPLNESSGALARGYSYSQVGGSFAGTPSWILSPNIYSYAFMSPSLSSSYLSVPMPGATCFNATGSTTFMFWFKAAFGSGAGDWRSYLSAGPVTVYLCPPGGNSVCSGNEFGIHINPSGSSGCHKTVYATNGVWQHIAVVLTGKATDFAIFFNGALATTAVCTSFVWDGGTGISQTFALGNRPPGFPFSQYEGNAAPISDFRMYPWALNISEIAVAKSGLALNKCAKGQFFNTSCQSCIPGYFCPNAFALVACPAGTYSSAFSAQTSATCFPYTCPCASLCVSVGLVAAPVVQPGSYCFNGSMSPCPAGFFCPLSSINATLCPEGTYSNAGAANCTLCPASTFASKTGSTSCQQCPGGHYCPTGTSSWARLNCGRGNYCPDGSSVPTPCPYQVSPTGGWGALQVQGLAFLVDTAHCLNHCFWNFTSGDGMLSKC